jgi:hypothetical protein
MMVRHTRVVLLNQKIDDETTSQGVDVQGLSNLAFYLIGNGITSGGAITYEESTDDPAHSDTPYSGTWSPIGSAVNASDVSQDKTKATHLTVGAYHRVRARISDAITGGGSISVVLVGCE